MRETKNIRKAILEMSFKSQAGHIPSAMSIVEILYSIYSRVKKDEDVFILSKGHGCLALYAVLVEVGLLNREELESFCKYDSILGGHPHRQKHKEFYCSAGSLGHGLPMAVGAALAKKIKGEKGIVCCLIGDGESNEGTVWESLMLAKNLNLNNLICIIDNNNSQTRSMPVHALEEKVKSFQWHTKVVDGHNVENITEALSEGLSAPLCLICQTTKGKGISEMETNTFAWHHGPPNKEQYDRFVKEVENA